MALRWLVQLVLRIEWLGLNNNELCSKQNMNLFRCKILLEIKDFMLSGTAGKGSNDLIYVSIFRMNLVFAVHHVNFKCT